MNTSTEQASGTLSYVSSTGDRIDRQVSLGLRQSSVVSDVIGTLFGITSDTVGFLLFTPVTGSYAITSRTYTTMSGPRGTFGTEVPVLAVSSALKAGQVRRIAALEDSSDATIAAARASTFRTNFGL